ncbi:MAG: hypothetical protein [Bat faecal associated anphe-like virus 1]|uniref:Nucleoprotein n=1 Tax=Bat faecal associated anphe-like virus 1 TaxID=2972716 RepID=A0AAE9NIQ3_9MONO|nr:MAG: hypothetical protein [Bat faecal associated anphe-like virus 1]
MANNVVRIHGVHEALRRIISGCVPPRLNDIVIDSTRYIDVDEGMVSSFFIKEVRAREGDPNIRNINTMANTDMDFCMTCYGIDIPAYEPSAAPTPHPYGQAPSREMPSFGLSMSLAENVIGQRNCDFLTPEGHLSMPHVVGLVFSQPKLKDYYRDYLLDPDTGVTIKTVTTADSLGEYLRNVGLGNNSLGEGGFTYNEMGMLFAIFALCINKSVQSTDQQADFIKKRLSAVRNQLMALEFSNPDEVISIFSLEAINVISSSLNFYPKFKFMLASAILRGLDDPVLLHLTPFLESSQLTVFTMIYDFLKSDELTQAHICGPVVEQALVWHSAFVQIEEKYGIHWRYFKIFEPSNTITAQAKWPILACAAWLHAMIKMGKQTLINVVINRVSITYLKKKLAQKIPNEYITRDDVAGAHAMTEALRDFMGLNENYRDAPVEELDEDVVEAANDIISRLDARIRVRN